MDEKEEEKYKNKYSVSEKQRQCVDLVINDKLKRINILEGSVRSGKTYVSLIMWAVYVGKKPKDAVFLMAGKTLITLKRNVLEPLVVLCGKMNFNYSISKKEGMLFGRKIYFEGVNDVRSETKIRGLTLDGAYCDEIILFDEEFFAMLLSRLSKDCAKLIGTTNPDNPNHWLKKKYLESNNLDLLDLKFKLKDNESLSVNYINNLEKEYKGVYHDRFIKGLWVAAEGRIYSDFDQKKCVLPESDIKIKITENPLILAVVGVDYGGNKSASVFNLVGFDKNFRNVYLLREYYDGKNKSAEHLINAFREKIFEWKNEFAVLAYAYCDSAEQLLVKSFRAAVKIEVKNALKKPISQRITMLNRLISSERFFVDKNCTHFIEAIETAVWDEHKNSADIRLDDGSVNIDSIDAFEYAIERYEREIFWI